MIYVQHLLGIGHLMRARLIAEALADAGCDVHLVTRRHADRRAHAARRAHRAAAADPRLGRELHAAARRRLRSHRRRLPATRGATCCSRRTTPWRPTPSSSRRSRSAGVRCASSSCRCSSASTRRARGPLVVGSVRDILQIQQKPEREREMLGWAKTWFDAILVHGDPRFARFEETFPLLPELGPPVHYTGFVLAPGRSARDRRRRRAAGSGGVGGRRRGRDRAPRAGARGAERSRASAI